MTLKSPQSIYHVENLTKAYGASSAYNEVVKEINLQVNLGDYLVILGPSGSGKSTLLYLLAGLEKPTKGNIYLRGQNIAHFSANELANFHRISIGIVYQAFHLLPSFTVLENIAFPLALQGLRLRKRMERSMEVLARFSIDSLANHYPSQISGGQQQKVAIARAMINMPPILLIDEPTGNLDSASSQEIMEIIYLLHNQGNRTIILVSHNPEFVKYSTNTVHMMDGKIYKNIGDIKFSELEKNQIETMEKIKNQSVDDVTSKTFGKNPFED